jgi:hypothetical protein
MLKPIPALVITLTMTANTFASQAFAAWEKVPPMNWAGIKLADFADHELEVPYHLEHFHKVANAIVEEGPNRGFIGITVNRRPQDNKPHNARILENNAWIAYFYATKKPWNPYYAMPAVRQRLEALLDFWCRSQSPEGYFSEYKPQGWNLAATGFGVLFMSRTLDLLNAPDAPPFDRAILERTMQAQRKAIMAILNDPMLRRTATSYHNQYTGVYRAAIRYLQLRPDAEMQTALTEHSKWADANTQSKAGFFFEANHPDFGYSRVHDANLLNTEAVLSQAPEAVRKKLIEEYRRYNLWLAANYLLEPDRSGYFVNAGLQNRTAHWFHKYAARPLAAVVEETWPFSVTAAEYAADIRQRRATIEKDWPKLPPLTNYSSRNSFFATDGLPGGFPTEAQRAAAIAKLPYLARQNYVQLRYEPRGVGVLFVRRPTYYVTLNFGRSEGNEKPVLGLGLLWNQNAGTVAQTLPAPNDNIWGTRLDGQERYTESRTLQPTLAVGGETVTPQAGIAELADKTVVAAWPLGEAGTKTVTFERDEIRVAINAKGGFVEQIPLILRQGDTLEQKNNQLIRTRGAQPLIISVEGGQIQPLPATPANTSNVRRVNVQLKATDKLSYTLRFPTRQ